MAMNYAKSGVHIKLGDEASKILYDAAKQTFANREGKIGEVIVPFDDFSGVRAVNVGNLPKDTLMCMGFDGVGTKVEIAQRVGDHSTIAYDLFAMVCDDAIVRGAEPVLIGTVLDVNSLGTDEVSLLPAIKQLAAGYVAAAKAANVAIVNGELAELGHAVGGYGAFMYNWCAGIVWFAPKEKLFTGKEIRVGDGIVLVREKGFRSNGLSLARKTFSTQYGELWHQTPFEHSTLGAHVLEPSTIYAKAVVALHGGFASRGTCTLHGVAHITGGGIPGKLGRALKASGFGATLEHLFAPCSAMLHCQTLGEISDEEAYRTWNMGQGLAIVTPEPQKVVAELQRLGHEALVAGSVTKERRIVLRSKGAATPGATLTFPIE